MLEILEDKSFLAIDLKLFKARVNLSHETMFDDYIIHIIKKATDIVETYTQRTITLKKWKYTHTNNVLYLPRPMIKAVMSVRSDEKELELTDYRIAYVRDTRVLILKEKFAMCNNTVIYTAGYEKADDIPFTLSNVIFDCAVALLQEENGAKPIIDQTLKDMLNQEDNLFPHMMHYDELKI